MEKMKIGIDLDGVVFMTLHRVLEEYNRIRGCSYTVDDIKSWDSHQWLNGDRFVYEIFEDPRLYRDLPVFPGVREVMKELDSKHDVFLVTDTPMQCLPARMEQLHELFPREEYSFMRERRFFICKFKEMILVDVLLEDKPSNIIKFAAAGHGIPVVFDWELNRELRNYDRVKSWKEFGLFIERLEKNR